MQKMLHVGMFYVQIQGCEQDRDSIRGYQKFINKINEENKDLQERLDRMQKEAESISI